MEWKQLLINLSPIIVIFFVVFAWNNPKTITRMGNVMCSFIVAILSIIFKIFGYILLSILNGTNTNTQTPTEYDRSVSFQSNPDEYRNDPVDITTMTNQLRGRIEDEGNVLIIKDAGGKALGRYDKSSNLTTDMANNALGRGNILPTLLK